MAMDINRSYNPFPINSAERMKEKQSLERAEKTKEDEKTAGGGKVPDKAQEPKDEYISSEKSGVKFTGLYRIGQDEDGKRKIFFNNPKKSGNADGKEQLKVNEGYSEESVKKGTMDTGKADREIKRLKEKRQQLEQQIRSASGDQEKVRELEKKLAQVESELSQKDNDAYRRQNASFSD